MIQFIKRFFGRFGDEKFAVNKPGAGINEYLAAIYPYTTAGRL